VNTINARIDSFAYGRNKLFFDGFTA
jgi:hypothetical protein